MRYGYGATQYGLGAINHSVSKLAYESAKLHALFPAITGIVALGHARGVEGSHAHGKDRIRSALQIKHHVHDAADVLF